MTENLDEEWDEEDEDLPEPDPPELATVPSRRRQRLERAERNAAARLALASPEPWPDSVDGAKLLDMLVVAIRTHVVMSDGAAVAIALWVLHAHALDAFPISPRLALTSPEKRSGKTTLLDVLASLVPRPLPTANATAPAIFRAIELFAPTLLVDECDTFLRRNDELRGVLNSGHRRATAYVLRIGGRNHTPVHFPTWSATVLAMIGRLPETLADRSIEVRLVRRRGDEPIQRFSLAHAEQFAQILRMAARWAADHIGALRNADPEIPQALGDRAADNWRPLLAIAGEVGGEWPECARAAAICLAFAGAGDGSALECLLADIRFVFGEVVQGHGEFFTAGADPVHDRDRIRSRDLAEALAAIEGRRWAEWGNKRQPITANAVARLLQPIGIAPATLRFSRHDNDGGTRSVTDRGYLPGQFTEAFSRYLPQ